MKNNLIVSVLGFFLITLVSGCSVTPIDDVEVVEIKTEKFEQIKPLLPDSDVLQLKPIEWLILTESNVSEVFGENRVVLFALTPEHYEALSLNVADIRILIEQQKKIIEVYESQYK